MAERWFGLEGAWHLRDTLHPSGGSDIGRIGCVHSDGVALDSRPVVAVRGSGIGYDESSDWWSRNGLLGRGSKWMNQ